MNAKTIIRMLAPAALGLGLLVLAWGYDNARGFFAHPARTGLVVVVLAGIAVAVAMRMDIQVFRRGQRPVGRQRIALPAIMLTAAALIMFLSYADRRSILTFGEADFLRYLGLALYTLGNTLAFFAVAALGRLYSGYVTLQKDHKLVQTGIYGAIRHPIYLRALMVAIGLPLIFRSWLVFLFLALAILFVTMRIRKEERLLAEEFGAEFEAYRQRTWRLIPYVY